MGLAGANGAAVSHSANHKAIVLYLYDVWNICETRDGSGRNW